MAILAISTSTDRGSAAVFSNRESAAPAASYADLRSHAERVFEAIDGALAAAAVTRAELVAVACDLGPGSFTGVRVGVASAKGIAMALGIPLVGVVGLEAMAAAAFASGAAGAGDVVVAAVDAKKGEVFVAAYALVDGALVVLDAPRHVAFVHEAFVPASELAVGVRVVVVGEIAAALAPPVPGLVRGSALDLPDAGFIARLGYARHLAGGSGDPAFLEPLYVRAPDAKPMLVPPTEPIANGVLGQA